MPTESIEKLHIRKKKMVTVLVAVLLLLPLFTRPTAACYPPCPPCYRRVGSECVWDCGSGTCCNGTCCNGTCCGNNCCSSGETCCNGECLHCPTQSAIGFGAQCGTIYGGYIEYCYCGAQNWWFKESVTWGAHTCSSGGIGQTSDPFPSIDGCVIDQITNSNGPPQDVGPCSDTTYQTVYCGPTKATVEQCSYNNTQVITVSSGSSPGTVTTSSAGASVHCGY
jgi:hypothetical protein